MTLNVSNVGCMEYARPWLASDGGVAAGLAPGSKPLVPLGFGQTQ